MKKILILSNSLRAGGAEKQSIILASVLQKEYDVTLVIFNKNDIDPKLDNLIRSLKIKILILHGNIISNAIKLLYLIKQRKIDIIISYLARTNFLNAFIGKISGVKIRVGGIRNSYMSNYKMLFQRFLHNNLLTCSISNSYRGKYELERKGFKGEKIYVIQNAFIGKYYMKTKINNNITYILSVGRFVAQKDYITAIKSFEIALNECFKKNHTIKYLILGYGEKKKEIELYLLNHKIKNVEIIENPKNLEKYFMNADIFLSTSLFEGFSNSIMEAMAYSLPIIATNVGDNSYLIKDNYNGFLVNVGDYHDIGRKIVYLVLNKDIRIQMGLNSYFIIKNNFTIDNFKVRYLELLKDLND